MNFVMSLLMTLFSFGMHMEAEAYSNPTIGGANNVLPDTH
jgi:hypothetical protein